MDKGKWLTGKKRREDKIKTKQKTQVKYTAKRERNYLVEPVTKFSLGSQGHLTQ